MGGHCGNLSVGRFLNGRSRRNDGCDRGSGGWRLCSRLHGRDRDRWKSRGVPNVFEEGGKNGVDRGRCDDRRRNWSVCEEHGLGSWRIYTNRSRGRACVGSLTMGSEVFYCKVRDRGESPPCAVTDEGVVKRVFPVVKCVKVGARLLIAGEEKVFGFSSSEVLRIVYIEVVADSSDKDVQTTCAIECIYFVFT